MRTMLVGYDLNHPGQFYEPLWERLRSYPNWWHWLDSTWLIKTNDTHEEVRDELKRFIDVNDELLVVDVTQRGAAWTGFGAEGSAWIKQHI